MRARRLQFAAFVVFLLVAGAALARRPGDLFNLMAGLNGYPMRPPQLQADGGALSLYATGATPSCVTVRSGQPYAMECVNNLQSTSSNGCVCLYSTDAGCSCIPSDPNWGHLLVTNTPLYFMTSDNSPDGGSRICGRSEDAGTLICPISEMH